MHKGLETLWGSVIKSKYEEENCWVFKEITSPYGVSLWRSIRDFWPSLKTHSMIRVHNGFWTMFWKDKWIGTRSLQELSLDLFHLSQVQHNTIAEIWTQPEWDMRFRRGMNDQEVPRVVELFKQLESFQGMQEGVDCLWWNEHPEGLYKVSS